MRVVVVEIAVTNAVLDVVKRFSDGDMWKEIGKRRGSYGVATFFIR
jgi:hypothetical protein